MKKLSAEQLIAVAGGLPDQVVIDVPAVHTEERPSLAAYLPTLRDTLIFLGGALICGLGIWAVSSFKDTPSA